MRTFEQIKFRIGHCSGTAQGVQGGRIWFNDFVVTVNLHYSQRNKLGKAYIVDYLLVEGDDRRTFTGTHTIFATEIFDRDDVNTYKKILDLLIPEINAHNNIQLNVNYHHAELIMGEYFFQNVTVYSNVGTQTTDVTCVAFKRFINKKDVTWVERVLLKKKLYSYRLDITPKKPIRENRDKDFLGGFSVEGNDATYNIGTHIPFGPNGEDPVFSDLAIWKITYEALREYDPKVRIAKAEERRNQKEPWTNRVWFRRKTKRSYFSLSTRIYPFSGDPLSGWTDILAVELMSDDESGYGIDLAFLGVHFMYYNEAIYRFAVKIARRSRPKWENGVSWNDYRPLVEKWQKDHKLAYVMTSDWRLKLAINRASGLHFRREFEHGSSSKWGWEFNPLRTKYWNII